MRRLDTADAATQPRAPVAASMATCRWPGSSRRASEGRVLDALRLALQGVLSEIFYSAQWLLDMPKSGDRGSRSSGQQGLRAAVRQPAAFDGGTRCFLTVVRDEPVDPRAVAAAAFAARLS